MLLPVLLLGMTAMTFFLAKALPGDPVYSMVGERSSPEIIEKIRREMGDDKGLLRQYAGYILLLSRGEMGRSYYTNRDVMEDIRSKLPNTFMLAIGAMIIAVPFGIVLGLLSALRRGEVLDRFVTGASVTLLSVPVFWSGLVMMLIFSLKLKLLPPSGSGGLRYLVLPAVALALPSAATFIRVTRVSVIDITEMPYIRTARAKGLRESRVNAVHILKNALIPIVTVIGLDFGSYLNGAVLTETIFGWDGIGRYMMEGIIKRDYPVIMGCILTGTFFFILINLAIDALYHYIDPRIRLLGRDR